MLSLPTLRRWRFASLTVLVAFSCMIYELVLAQTSAVFLGSALLNYSVTIALYLGALGLGSWLYARLRQPAKALLMAELALSYLGPLAPILILFMDWILRREIGAGGASYHLMLQSFVYLMIFVIGILSGLELPVLMSLGESLCELRSGAVLGLDYLGTLVAVAIFPLWGLGQLGLFGTAALAGLMTCSGAILTFWALPAATRPRWLLLSLVPALILVLGLLVFSDEVTTYLSHTIFLVAQ